MRGLCRNRSEERWEFEQGSGRRNEREMKEMKEILWGTIGRTWVTGGQAACSSGYSNQMPQSCHWLLLFYTSTFNPPENSIFIFTSLPQDCSLHNSQTMPLSLLKTHQGLLTTPRIKSKVLPWSTGLYATWPLAALWAVSPFFWLIRSHLNSLLLAPLSGILFLQMLC